MSAEDSQLASTSKTIYSREENLLDFRLSDEEETMEQQGDSAGGQQEVQSAGLEAEQQSDQQQRQSGAAKGTGSGAAVQSGSGGSQQQLQGKAATAAGVGDDNVTKEQQSPVSAQDNDRIRRKIIRVAHGVEGMAVRTAPASWHASKEEVFEAIASVVTRKNEFKWWVDACGLCEDIGVAMQRSVLKELRPLFTNREHGGLTVCCGVDTVVRGGVREIDESELATALEEELPGSHMIDLSDPFSWEAAAWAMGYEGDELDDVLVAIADICWGLSAAVQLSDRVWGAVIAELTETVQWIYARGEPFPVSSVRSTTLQMFSRLRLPRKGDDVPGGAAGLILAAKKVRRILEAPLRDLGAWRYQSAATMIDVGLGATLLDDDGLVGVCVGTAAQKQWVGQAVIQMIDRKWGRQLHMRYESLLDPAECVTGWGYDELQQLEDSFAVGAVHREMKLARNLVDQGLERATAARMDGNQEELRAVIQQLVEAAGAAASQAPPVRPAAGASQISVIARLTSPVRPVKPGASDDGQRQARSGTGSGHQAKSVDKGESSHGKTADKKRGRSAEGEQRATSKQRLEVTPGQGRQQQLSQGGLLMSRSVQLAGPRPAGTHLTLAVPPPPPAPMPEWVRTYQRFEQQLSTFRRPEAQLKEALGPYCTLVADVDATMRRHAIQVNERLWAQQLSRLEREACKVVGMLRDNSQNLVAELSAIELKAAVLVAKMARDKGLRVPAQAAMQFVPYPAGEVPPWGVFNSTIQHQVKIWLNVINQ